MRQIQQVCGAGECGVSNPKSHSDSGSPIYNSWTMADCNDKRIIRIVKDLEAYFGNDRDLFLFEQSRLDYGWIPVGFIFNLQRFEEVRNNDREAVLHAVVYHSSVLQLSKDRLKIRRKPSGNSQLDEDPESEDSLQATLDEFYTLFPPIECTDSSDENADETKEAEKPSGCYIHVTGPFVEATTPAELQAVIQEKYDGNVLIVYFNQEEHEAWACLQGENAAAKVVEKFGGKVQINKDLEVAIRVACEVEEDILRRRVMRPVTGAGEDSHMHQATSAAEMRQTCGTNVTKQQEMGVSSSSMPKNYPRCCLIPKFTLEPFSLTEKVHVFKDLTLNKPESSLKFEFYNPREIPPNQTCEALTKSYVTRDLSMRSDQTEMDCVDDDASSTFTVLTVCSLSDTSIDKYSMKHCSSPDMDDDIDDPLGSQSSVCSTADCQSDPEDVEWAPGSPKSNGQIYSLDKTDSESADEGMHSPAPDFETYKTDTSDSETEDQEACGEDGTISEAEMFELRQHEMEGISCCSRIRHMLMNEQLVEECSIQELTDRIGDLEYMHLPRIVLLKQPFIVETILKLTVDYELPLSAHGHCATPTDQDSISAVEEAANRTLTQFQKTIFQRSFESRKEFIELYRQAVISLVKKKNWMEMVQPSFGLDNDSEAE